MNPRGTRLATVLRVRRIQEDLHKAELGRALATAAVARDLARVTQERYDASVGAANPETAAAFRVARDHAAAAALQVARTKAAYELALGETERARVGLTQARTRTSGLERLVDRAREDAHRALLAADQRQADEGAARARSGSQ